MNLLTEQVEAGLRGDFKRGLEIADFLEKETPACNRAAFNRGWYRLMQGKFWEGYSLLDRGRQENVFGNRKPGTYSPIWTGQSGCTVMLYLEGGLGDQIHGLRFTRDIVNAGSKAVVSCSPELAGAFSSVPWVSAICQPEALPGVYHTHWLPSMSAPYHLHHQKADGKPYIARTNPMIEGKIGIRWKGNPDFEHEQYRVFPPELLFQVVEGHNCVSLQDNEKGPEWVEQVPLTTWDKTRDVISECELVITSCTSVAHLAGAMGVETWIIVPVLPYYLWAVPGEKTDHYDSVTLFRQEEDWQSPFKRIEDRLNERFIRTRRGREGHLSRRVA